jgi:hypothetical protein
MGESSVADSQQLLLESQRGLAGMLLGEASPLEVLEHVASLGCQAVPAAEMAGLTLAAVDGGPKTIVATNRVAPAIDQAQYERAQRPADTSPA